MKKNFLDLTKFETMLWILSLVVVLISFVIPAQKDILTLIASLIGVTALIYVSKGYVLGQVLTVFFAVFYGIISFYFKYYGEMITYLCMTAPIAVMAVISWAKNPYKGTKEVTVSKMTKTQIYIMWCLALLVTVAFYFILKALGNENLIVSTISVTTSFLASFMTYTRSPYYAIGYSANDVILIILWALASAENPSYLPMVLCFVMFLVNDLYGFYNWRKMRIKQKNDLV